MEEVEEGRLQIFPGEVAHAVHLQLGLVHGHAVRIFVQVCQVAQALLLLRAALRGEGRQQAPGQRDEGALQRQGGQRRDDGEERMGVGDLARHVAGRQGLDARQDGREEGDERADQNGAEEVEHQVEQGDALAFAAGGEGSQKVGRHGADRRADDQPDGLAVTQQPLLREGLEDDDGGRGTLQQRREGDAEEHARQRVFQRADEGDEAGIPGQGRNGTLHHADADEEHAEAQDDRADVAHDGLFDEHGGDAADEKNHRRIGREVEGRDLCGDGGADVGAQDDAEGLREGHEAGRDKADEHHVRGAGALDEQRDQQADRHAGQPVGGDLLQDFTQLVAGGVFEAGGHERHSVQKKSDAAKQGKGFCQLHR